MSYCGGYHLMVETVMSTTTLIYVMQYNTYDNYDSLFCHSFRTNKSNFVSTNIFETLALLDLITDIKYFSFYTLHLKEFCRPPILYIAYNFLFVMFTSISYKELAHNFLFVMFTSISYKELAHTSFGVIAYRDCDLDAFVYHIYTIRWFRSNLYFKQNINCCSNAQGIRVETKNRAISNIGSEKSQEACLGSH
jgi:hypothetical protein